MGGRGCRDYFQLNSMDARFCGHLGFSDFRRCSRSSVALGPLRFRHASTLPSACNSFDRADCAAQEVQASGHA